MKKTLIAFAALSAIAGMAQAQSSVTLYGLVDAYFGQTQTETTGALTGTAVAAGTKVKQTVVNSSGQNNSRWGLRGTEDLGGGLKGVFALEGGFNTDTGSFGNISEQGGALFGRQAFVGVSSGFGTLSLGRHLTAYDALRGSTNMIYDSNFATTASVWGGESVVTGGTAAVAAVGALPAVAATTSRSLIGLRDYSARASNSISYASPDFAGFSAGVVYGLGENKTAAVSAESNASLRIQYANGPLLVGYAHQQEKQFIGGTYFGGVSSGATTATAAGVNVAASASTFNSKRKYNLVGASYDLGVVKLVAQYNQAKGQNSGSTSAKDDEFQIGVSVPFGAAAIAAGYSVAKSETTGGPTVNENTGSGVSLLGTYALSKRTNVYAGFRATKLEAANSNVEAKASLVAVGVRHLF